MRKQIVAGIVLAMGFGTQALAAEGFSYNLAEVGYVSSEIGGIDGDGFTLGGSAEFGENLFGFASLVDADFDGGIGTSQFSAGVGFHWGLSPALDLVSGFSFERFRVRIGGLGSASDTGFGLSTGLRGRVGDRLELSGAVKYIDLGGGVDDFTLSAGGRYYFTEAFAGGIDVSDNDDGTTWGIALRYDFGGRY